MALTPEDVVNKRFKPTRFSEGYDQDEVDDFLDEVVAELRRVYAENDELRQKLSACEERVGQLSRAGAGAGTAAPPARPEPREVTAPQPAVPAQEPKPAEPAPAPVPAPAPAAAAAAVGGPNEAAGMLALAQRLHDEHVRSGEEQRDKIIADARAHAERVVREAEDKQRQTLGTLEQERSLLERKIDELRSFERDYRTRLKSYLQDQLRELEAKGAVVPGPGAGANQFGQGGQQGGGFGYGRADSQG